MFVIIDEVSMVGSNMLLQRLQQRCIQRVKVFGVSILAVGDLFSTGSDCYPNLYGSGSLWVDHFELTEVMR